MFVRSLVLSDGYFKAIIAADAEKSRLSSAATNNYSNYFIFVFFGGGGVSAPSAVICSDIFLNIMTNPRLEFRQPKYSVIKQPKSQSASFIMLWKQAGKVKCLKLWDWKAGSLAGLDRYLLTYLCEKISGGEGAAMTLGERWDYTACILKPLPTKVTQYCHSDR